LPEDIVNFNFCYKKVYKEDSYFKIMKRVIDKAGQVWIETVIYTLIGLAIIGLVLATALPKINEKKDSITIEQSIEALGNINNKVYEVQRAEGNRRIVNLDIRKGALIVDMEKDTISWLIDSSFPYSEVGIPVSLGILNVTTREGNPWVVELKLGYDIDLTYNGINTGTKQLDSAPTPYRFTIEHAGNNVDGDIMVDLSDI